MAALVRKEPRAGTPTETEILAARESGRTLAPYLGRRHGLHIQVIEEDNPSEIISLPEPAVRLLADILAEMADGNAVTVIPTHEELTTQQAADLLNVSRPFLIGLLEEGKLPYHKVGTHRRIMYQDLINYKAATDAARRRALEELAAQAQEFGMGY